MKPATKKIIVITAFVLGIAFLSAIDIALNVISLIPGVGDVFETTSETVIELLQVFLATLGLIVVSIIKN